MLLRSGSSREENKMLLPLPLSFPALRIFPYNERGPGGGRGRKKPKRLREDAQLLGPFFQCNTGKRPLFVIPWPIGIAAFGLCLPALYKNKIPARPGKALATTERKGSM